MITNSDHNLEISFEGFLLFYLYIHGNDIIHVPILIKRNYSKSLIGDFVEKYLVNNKDL